jgi:hypothetical protein
MSLKHLARHAFSLSPHIALAKSLQYGGHIIKSNMRQIIELRHSSFQPRQKGTFHKFLTDFDSASIALDLPIDMVREHRFDLLGSGWVNVAHAPHTGQISPGNRKRSAAIRDLVDSDYAAIDWQLDFKSGYRWRQNRLSGTLRYGHEPGVDVKVPWELARLQHLPWLAIVKDEVAAREFRNQVLDFAAANPPGYGVNWLCTMDVAIRAANILLAYDLFVCQGFKFDESFNDELHALIMAHGKHIEANLEWHDQHRANHYLADITGLLFVAAYLPRSRDTDSWLAFSIQQLIKEVERQFTPDGANFEASTSYHRLSAEMVIYATALVLGLPEDKKSALTIFDHRLWKNHPSLVESPIKMFQIPGSDKKSPFPDWYFERLEQMAEFTVHVTKPNGRIAQIGDNDSGRFFKICPSFVDVDGRLQEQLLDHRATVAAISGLFGREDFSGFAGPETARESLIIKALSGGQKIASYLEAGDKVKSMGVHTSDGDIDDLLVVAETIIEPPDANVLNGLTTYAYPDFGLYIWRSPRFFLSVRCGPVGQNGNGGHAHNDQLAIELNIDGEDWIADPGTYLYTPSPKDRNAYRSVHAHGAPKIGQGEPSRLDLGLFRLEDNSNAHCLKFDPVGFEGMHTGYGMPLHRRIELKSGSILITDLSPVAGEQKSSPNTVRDGKSLRELWNVNLPFSPGYGLRD